VRVVLRMQSRPSGDQRPAVLAGRVSIVSSANISVGYAKHQRTKPSRNQSSDWKR
jgi:hypothetical protein